MIKITWSKAFLLKFLRIQFREVSKRPWIVTWFYRVINSKTGKQVWLHEWTNKQINEPHPDMVKLANELKSNRSFADTVNKIEKWVVDNFRYVLDEGEEWLTAIETLRRKYDDCDGQNNLIYVLCMLAGVPSWLMWNVLGQTKDGLHFYCLFFYTHKMDLIPIDSTYYVETGSMKDQKPFRVSSLKYHYPDFIWNEDHTFKLKTIK